MAVGVLTEVYSDQVKGVFSCVYTAASSSAASSIFCGFTPRRITMIQTGGSAGATAESGWHKGMTAAYATLRGNTGTYSLETSNGFTVLDGTEASPTAKATNSPLSAGMGFTLGTAVQANSLVYTIYAER